MDAGSFFLRLGRSLPKSSGAQRSFPRVFADISSKRAIMVARMGMCHFQQVPADVHNQVVAELRRIG